MSSDIDALLAPNSGNDFQSLCMKVIGSRVFSNSSYEYGGPGVGQHGIDFWVKITSSEHGRPDEIIGVQCKHKDRLRRNSLTGGVVKSEVEKAKNFQPMLTRLIIATSAPTSKKIQDLANEISKIHAACTPPLFCVEVWFWEKIRQEFSFDPVLFKEVLHRFYPHFYYIRDPGQSKPLVLPLSAQYFIGRSAEVAWLKEKLLSQDRIALIGAGGAGKTAIARAAIDAIGQGTSLLQSFPNGIYFHDYYVYPDHTAAIDSIVVQSGLSELRDRDREVQARLMLSRGQCLVFLEGCENANEINRMIDICGPSTLLITSRRKSDGKRANALIVPPLPSEESAQLIYSHATSLTEYPCSMPASNAPVWKNIASLIGGHPLALRLAGSKLRFTNIAIDDFYLLLQESGFLSYDDDTHSKESIDCMLRHSSETLSIDAKILWFVLSIHALAPLDIPALSAGLGIPNDRTNRALEELMNHSIALGVRINDDHSSTVPAWQLSHSLISEWARRRPHCLVAETKAVADRCREWWQSYLERCFDCQMIEGGARRYSAVVGHLAAQISYTKSINDEYSREVADFSVLIAELHRLMGRYQLAQTFLRDAILIFENIYTPKHPRLLKCVSSLAGLLHQKGELIEAEVLHRRSFNGLVMTKGADNPDTITSMNNLAVCLKLKGEYKEAEDLYRRALEIRRKMFGLGHADTIASLNNLANLLSNKGDLAGAETYFRRALKCSISGLGNKHLYTLMIENNLAEVLLKNGQLEDSEVHCASCLSLRREVLGNDHVDTNCSLHTMALIREKQGRIQEASELAEVSVEGLRESLLAQHPWLQEAETNLERIRGKITL